MAVRGRGSLKFLEDPATLSKKELNKMEKDAERRTAGRKKLKESGKKAPSGTRRARVQARRVAEKNIPKAVRDQMVSQKQDAQNKSDEKIKSENRTGRPTGTRGPQKPAPKGTLSQITKTAEEGLKLAKKLARATGVFGLLSADKLGDGSLYKGKTEAEVSRIIERKAKTQKSLSEKAKKPRTTANPKPTGSAKDPKKAYSYNEAKNRGLSTYIGKDGKTKATVSADELRKAGYTTGPKGLRKFLNDRAKKAKK